MNINSCTPINPKRYSCYGLKKIHTRNLITKKHFYGSKIPLPHHFSNGLSLTESILWPIIDPILVTFGEFLGSQLSHFLIIYDPVIVNEEHFTFHLQYKHAGTFMKNCLTQKNQKMCDPIIVNPP